ncbi:MAG: hypothetical protein ACRDL7_12965, partial [Gaiellaceae bacterium]
MQWGYGHHIFLCLTCFVFRNVGLALISFDSYQLHKHCKAYDQHFLISKTLELILLIDCLLCRVDRTWPVTMPVLQLLLSSKRQGQH